MRKFFALAAVCATAASVQAQTLTDTWSYAGGGLSPATYGAPPAAYRPASLVPDVGSAPGASIGLSGLTTGGLGSGTYPEGYGGIYTFFSENVQFSLQNTNVLAGVETITVSFLSGGGTGYTAGSMFLNFNLDYASLASSSFSSVSAGSVETPIGLTAMTRYTWTWNVSGLGASTGYGVNWTAGTHTFFSEISTAQAVPEPSTFLLTGLGLGAVLYLRKRMRRSSDSSV